MMFNFRTIGQLACFVIGFGVAFSFGAVMTWDVMTNRVFPKMAAGMPAPVVVLPAGHPVQLDGQIARVFGHDDYDCDGGTCKGLKIEPGNSKEVTLAIRNGLRKERWTFAKIDSQLIAVRPNGEYVLALK